MRIIKGVKTIRILAWKTACYIGIGFLLRLCALNMRFEVYIAFEKILNLTLGKVHFEQFKTKNFKI